ncbi:MAG: PAS domain S-box protein [Desulfobacterales bacterium]
MTEIPINEAPEKKGQFVPIPWRMYVLICIVGLTITGILGYGFYKGDRISKVYAPLVDAAMEIKLETAIAHLWFEEIISGDRYEDMDEVWKHQDQAEWYAKAMLEGGKNPEGTFVPLDDAEMRAKIKSVLGKLREFREITQKRMETKEGSGIGTEIDQRYDQLFQSFLTKADEVESKLQQIMAKDLSRFRYTQVLLIVICILLFSAIGASFWYFDGQRVKHLLLLNEANRALVKSEAHLSITLHSIGDAVIATDTEGHVVRMNPIAEKLTGWKLAEAMGRPLDEVFNIINEQTRQRVESPVEKVLHEGVIVGLANHTILISKHGTEYSVDDSGAPIRDEQGKVTGVVLVFRDVSEKILAERELLASEEKYRLLFEKANIAILVAQDGVIKSPNPKALDLHGYSDAEFTSRPFMDFVHPEDQRMVQDRHERRIGGEELPDTYSYRIVNKAGDTKWVELNVVPLLWEGLPATLCFMTDITERKELEDQLQQSQKMEAVGTLAGGIAHDFNNILGIIMGNTELTLHDMPKEDPNHEYLTQALAATGRAKDLVRQILTFSRQSKQDEKPLAIGIVIKEVLKMLRSSLPTTIEIQQNIEKDTGLIMADPTQIHQIIMNLATNASHAMGDSSGVLKVSVANIETDDLPAEQNPDLRSGSYVKLTVSDTGHGMGHRVMERIFDPYYTTKEIGHGTGLGLSVIHGIVLSHGGAINVHSEPGEGTTFEILFPKIEPVGDGTKIKEKETIPTGTERILLVDDEPAMAQIYQSMLKRLGYTVSTRTSSIEALEAFKAQPDKYDVIVTDQTMPHLTGQMMAREMMNIRPDIPVILCTGHSNSMNADLAKAAGMSAFVMKPIAMGEIARAIRDVLDK